MVKLIFTLFTIFTLSFQFVVAQKYPREVLADIDAHCKKEWTKRGELDQRMYEYCVSHEKEGHDNMKYIESVYANYSWFQELKSHIIEKWTKAGVTEWRMVGYSLEKEIDAFLDIEYGLKHSEFKKEDYNLCYSYWKKANPNSVWGMTLYCLKNP